MNKRKKLNKIRERRKTRVRAKTKGTPEKPRFSIFKSNRYIYAQLIDDSTGKTLVSASKISSKDASTLLGEIIGKKSVEKGIKNAIFDRGDYKYHGRVKAIADAARKTGLKI